jgi:hypothetical protein
VEDTNRAYSRPLDDRVGANKGAIRGAESDVLWGVRVADQVGQRRMARERRHPEMKWRTLALGTVAIVIPMVMALPAGALNKTQLQAKTLSLTDLPTGWKVDHSTGSGVSGSGCFKGLGKVSKGTARVAVAFTSGQFPLIQETLESGKGSVARFNAYRHELANCTHVNLHVGGQTIRATIHPVTFATGVPGSSTYTISFSVQGQAFGFDEVLLHIGKVVASVGWANTGAPDPSQMQSILTTAIAKIKSAATVKSA